MGLVIAVLALLPLLPPVRGAMLLVPVAPGASVSLVRDAIGGGALLLGSGPWAGTVVVVADRPGFAWRMMRAGVLPLAATAAGCGSPAGTRADAGAVVGVQG